MGGRGWCKYHSYKYQKKIKKKIREVDGEGQNLPYTNWKSMEKAVKKK